MPTPAFVMVCCQCGAEAAVKAELATQGWRLAFSRPGFVTVKRDEGSDAQRAAKSTQELPAGIFCRTVGWSLGKTRGEESGPLLQELEAILDAAAPEETFDQLHVWPRDRRPVGSMQFEPGPDPLSDAVAETLWQPLSAGGKITAPAANLTAQPGQRVLDVVLVEPNEWWIGWHSVQATPSRWPGSVLPLPSAEPPVSRAYYKLAEALAWSQWDLHPDDMAIEIGSSPGGACQRLLELGLQVIGIDPADMDERILEHPRFTHIRARASDLKRSVYQPARWLVSDASTRPETMLTAIEKIVTHSSSRVEGMLLTCKLRSYERATEIPAWIERVQSFGFPDVQARQLAANRCEITLAAHRPR